MNKQPLRMPRSEWEAVCAATSSEMANYVPQYMTPISRILRDDEGMLEGTGSYVGINNEAYLLTNEHVAVTRKEYRLGHMFNRDDKVHVLVSDIASTPPPIDAAIARVELAASASAVPLSLYADCHDPAKGELLFIAGYPGERSGFAFGTLFTPLASYVVQEDVSQSAVLGAYHFAIPWLPDRAQKSDPRAPNLSLPPGMSGSLVWNTRLVEFAQCDQRWSPEDARVTGVVRSWSDCATWVYATRVEHLRAAFPALIEALK